MLSGDTLVLVGKSINGPPPEITITLNHIQTPKLSRGSSQIDEPYAWESREYLRHLLIGKHVQFKVTNTVSSINRTFGMIFFNGQNVIKLMLSAGWATLKDQMMRDDVNADEYNELNQLYNEAKNNKYGIHTGKSVYMREREEDVCMYVYI